MKLEAGEDAETVRTSAPIIPCQWVHSGKEVLLLKCTDKDGKAHGGFQYPLEVGASVEAPDWNTRPECGGGLHGCPWGLSMQDGREADWNGRWIVLGCKPEDVIDLGGKCKAKRGVVRFVGTWHEALMFVLPGQIAFVAAAAQAADAATGVSGAASATGVRGAASATGEGGAASATGWSGAASATGAGGAASATGVRGAASATGAGGAASATGVSGAASATGESGAASATGWSGAASATGEMGAASATGDNSAAVVTGELGRARAGRYGCIALSWWNKSENRAEMRCRETGCGDGSDRKLKANVWYRLDDGGSFVEE